MAINPPLTFTTVNHQNVDLNGVNYSSLNVSHVGADVYTKAESNTLFGTISFPLPNYGVSTDTTTYENTTVQSLYDHLLQELHEDADDLDEVGANF